MPNRKTTFSTLLIEDNAGDARLIREYLREASDLTFNLQVVETLADAITLLDEQVFDVILCDLSLPDSFGVETVVRVRDQTAHAAIVVLTGYDDQAAGVEAVKAGAQDYLVKGDVNSRLLVRSIRYAAERQRAESALKRSYAQAEELAAMQERQRLARELHDSVSQTLFTCSAMAEAALRQWDINPQKAHEHLEDVHQLTQTALTEMRVLLLELRPSALAQVSLKQLFSQYLQPIERRANLHVGLSVDEVALPPDVQITFYRVVQEALNNIQKHAQAQAVSIRVADEGAHVRLTVHDDGRGFDPAQVNPTSLGLEIIHERAAAIGAQVTLESAVGLGTTLSLAWQKPAQGD